MKGDTRSTHGPEARSSRLDVLAFYASELGAAEMDAALKAHLISRLRRMMRSYFAPAERDFAAAEERIYRVTVDPSVPAAERRRALAQWMTALRELALVARRSRGAVNHPAPARKRARSIYALAPRPRRRPSPPAPAEDAGEGAGSTIRPPPGPDSDPADGSEQDEDAALTRQQERR